MDLLYAGGVVCIQYIQELYSGSETLMTWLNNAADPHYSFVYVFPMISLIDSAFAAQYLLVMAGGQWVNVLLKWVLAEHRPFWWVQETDYYGEGPRPALRQFAQTCETGPGCPSGHVMSAVSHLVLLVMWISHVAADRGGTYKWLMWPLWPAMLALVVHVGLARMFVATHFPHQVFLGALCGLFITPALTIYISDPFIWGSARGEVVLKRVVTHLLMAKCTIAAGLIMYWGMKSMGVDPAWSVKLAFKWCEDAHHIKVSTTPQFALVEGCAGLVGWAAFVAPVVSRYRYNTKQRSLLIALTCGAAAHYLFTQWNLSMPTDDAVKFYLLQFAFMVAKTLVYLRVIPLFSTLPWRFIKPTEVVDKNE